MKLIVIACLLAVSLGAAVPKRGARPKFTKSGKPVIGERIVGGYAIDISAAPYQVALEENGYLFCGGSIVNEYQVVSAAHCVRGSNPDDIKIRAGSSILESEGSVHQVVSYEYNYYFDLFYLDYDVSILTVDTPFVFDETRQPISLTDAEPEAGEQATVSGWGTEHEGDWGLPVQLHQVDVPIVGREECEAAYPKQISERMICAGIVSGGLDSCQGDSGGPLVVNGRLAGIVSWGRGCAREGYPGVYTNVISIRPWIEERLKTPKNISIVPETSSNVKSL